MTVTYTAEVATCKGFGCFLKLLFRWKASIYKLVWLDLLCFLSIYYILNFTYRWLLDPAGKRVFEGIVHYCLTYSELIPLSFVLGFYVSIVMTRWWNQYITIPWPDSIAVFVSAHVHGQDERGRLMRRTMMRYVCLCLTMVLTNISPKVKKRFPTLDHLIEAGLLLENERQIMVDLNEKFPKPSKHWLPIVWSASIVTRARKEGRIRDDFAVKTVIDELNKFRAQCGLLTSYDSISIPLVYTQVVTLAVYSYFATAIMARQWTEDKIVTTKEGSTVTGYVNNIDVYFPIFTTLQFFFYMGWLKVAESLINPFGEDDDDFEVNWMVDRNIQVSYLIVDEMHHEHPELIKDQYWDDVFPTELPYTLASEGNRETGPIPSTAKIEVPSSQQAVVMSSSSVKIDELVREQSVNYKFTPPENLNDDAVSGIHFSASGRRSIRRKPSVNSSASLQSTMQTPVPGSSIPRVNSVTSVLKRIFSREDATRVETDGGTNELGREKSFRADTTSTTSIPGKYAGGGSMRIADQVIEELDEQNTITSMATKQQENRPTAASIFGPPPPSAPMNMPSHPLTNFRNAFSNEPTFNQGRPVTGNHLMSSSAPLAWGELALPPSPGGLSLEPPRSRLDSDIGPSLSAAVSRAMVAEDETASISGSEEGEEEDEFHRLKAAREQERLARYRQKLMARSVSAQQNMSADCYADNEILLAELAKESNRRNKSKSNEGSDFSTSPKET